MPARSSKRLATAQKDPPSRRIAPPVNTNGRVTEDMSISKTSSGIKLDKLPAEILSMIASQLAWGSIKALRRVNRYISASIEPLFEKHCDKTRLIKMTVADLTMLLHKVESVRPARYLEKLIIGSHFTKSEKAMAATRDLLVRIVATCKYLKAIDVMIHDKAGFINVLYALCDIKSIDNLGVTGTHKGKGYAPPMDCFSDGPPLENLEPCLSRLKNFVCAVDRSSTSHEDSHETLNANCESVGKMLAVMPLLESLDLSFCWNGSTIHSEPVEPFYFESCLQAVLAMAKLQSLQLSRLHISEASLLALLKHKSLTKLQFTDIKLGSDNWLRTYTMLGLPSPSSPDILSSSEVVSADNPWHGWKRNDFFYPDTCNYPMHSPEFQDTSQAKEGILVTIHLEKRDGFDRFPISKGSGITWDAFGRNTIVGRFRPLRGDVV